MSNSWEDRRDRSFLESKETTDRVDQGINFLGQFLGWSGLYGNISPVNSEKRALFNATYGNAIPSLSGRPHIADQKILFTGEGFAPWVDWEGTQVIDYDQKEFQFPGAKAAATSTGFPLAEVPLVYRGSALYFEEPPLLQDADWDWQAEFVEPDNLWRVVIEGSGSFLLSSKSTVTEPIEVFIEDWEEGLLEPYQGETRFQNYYGAWGSKGTRFNMELLSSLVGVPGFKREHCLKIKPFSVTFFISEEYPPFEFDEVLVDGVVLSDRKIKGVQNISTLGSNLIRLAYDGGLSPDLLFDKVEIRLQNFSNGDVQFIDLTPYFLDGRQWNAISSVRNAKEYPIVWESQPFLVGVSEVGNNQGPGSSGPYLRLPYFIERGSEVWQKAESVMRLFSIFGEVDDVKEELEDYPTLPWSFYNLSYQKFRETRLFHEEYLISFLPFSEEEELEDGFSFMVLRERGEKEIGWKQPKVTKYSPESQRSLNVDGWVGGFYERVGEQNLSGFFARDLAEGSLMPARVNETPLEVPHFSYDYEVSTNKARVCYPYFTVGYSHPGDPFFDPGK